jgi:glutamyl-tRNA reductase
VEAIVNEEAIEFLEWLASLDVVSTITNLRSQIERLRLKELERLFNRLDLDEREQQLVATMSHRLVNKILHEPTLRLKKEATAGNSATYVSALHHLFALGPERNGK